MVLVVTGKGRAALMLPDHEDAFYEAAQVTRMIRLLGERLIQVGAIDENEGADLFVWLADRLSSCHERLDQALRLVVKRPPEKRCDMTNLALSIRVAAIILDLSPKQFEAPVRLAYGGVSSAYVQRSRDQLDRTAQTATLSRGERLETASAAGSFFWVTTLAKTLRIPMMSPSDSGPMSPTVPI